MSMVWRRDFEAVTPFFHSLRALSTEMQLDVEMPDKGSGETKVESEAENPVHSKPKLVFIKSWFRSN